MSWLMKINCVQKISWDCPFKYWLGRFFTAEFFTADFIKKMKLSVFQICNCVTEKIFKILTEMRRGHLKTKQSNCLFHSWTDSFKHVSSSASSACRKFIKWHICTRYNANIIFKVADFCQETLWAAVVWRDFFITYVLFR